MQIYNLFSIYKIKNNLFSIYFMKTIERVYKYLDFIGIKAIPFEKKVGLSNGYLGKQLVRKADLGEGILMKIIENCPEISPEWLLTGNGSMLKNEVKRGINQNVVGNGVTMVGGSVSGSVQSSNSNDNLNMQLFENQTKELQKQLKERDKEIERLKTQVDKLFKMIP